VNDWHGDCSFEFTNEAKMRWTLSYVVLVGFLAGTGCERPVRIEDNRTQQEKSAEAARKAGEDAYKAAAKAKELARQAAEELRRAGKEAHAGWEDAKRKDPNARK
jgi:F0F1-type ATP synthase membrane subunit b/b'